MNDSKLIFEAYSNKEEENKWVWKFVSLFGPGEREERERQQRDPYEFFVDYYEYMKNSTDQIAHYAEVYNSKYPDNKVDIEKLISMFKAKQGVPMKGYKREEEESSFSTKLKDRENEEDERQRDREVSPAFHYDPMEQLDKTARQIRDLLQGSANDEARTEHVIKMAQTILGSPKDYNPNEYRKMLDGLIVLLNRFIVVPMNEGEETAQQYVDSMEKDYKSQKIDKTKEKVLDKAKEAVNKLTGKSISYPFAN